MCDTFRRLLVTCYTLAFYLFCNFNRTYLSTDVIRRVMTQMFGIDVVLVMGVTDIDDKIIRRADQVHSVPTISFACVFTAGKRSCGTVMFSQVPVCHPVGGEGNGVPI